MYLRACMDCLVHSCVFRIGHVEHVKREMIDIWIVSPASGGKSRYLTLQVSCSSSKEREMTRVQCKERSEIDL